MLFIATFPLPHRDYDLRVSCDVSPWASLIDFIVEPVVTDEEAAAVLSSIV